jgi:hypothetical protein
VSEETVVLVRHPRLLVRLLLVLEAVAVEQRVVQRLAQEALVVVALVDLMPLELRELLTQEVVVALEVGLTMALPAAPVL